VRARTIPRDGIQRALVRLPNWLGDTVMALPTLRSLRSALPAAELWCVGPWAVDILESEPGISRRLVPPARVGARLAQARRLGQAGFDLALILPNSFETAVAGWLARARWRVGYAADGRAALLTHALRPDDGAVHQVTAYQRLLEPLGIVGSATPPTLTIDPARQSEARRLLAEVGVPGAGPRVGLQLGAAFGPAKLWPPDRIASLMGRLEARGIYPVLLGSAAARELADRVQAAAGGSVWSLVGRDRPALLAALVAELDAFFGRGQQALWHQPSCAPCFRPECPIDHRCLTAIEVSEVEAAVVAAVAVRR